MFARRLKYVPYAFYLLVLCAPFSAAADSEGMSLSASPCTGMDLTFSPVSFHFSALAGTQLLTVSSPATCQYYVRPLSGNFINPDGTVHTGPSTVDINVSANMSGTSRSGQIRLFAISGGPPVWVITVTQDGASSSQAVVTLTSPRGGEAWDAGTAQNITWTYYPGSPPVSGNVDIDLIEAGLVKSTIARAVPANTGQFLWTIPAITPAASDYQIHLVPSNGAIKDDESKPTVEIKPWHDPFDQLIKNLLKAQHIPGAQLGILRNGKLVYVEGYGKADQLQKEDVTKDSAFRIASVTKPFTAAAVYKLIEEKKLQFSDKVWGTGGILPEPPAIKDSRIRDITIQDLLAHRGGWDLADFYRQLNPNSTTTGDFDPMFASNYIAGQLHIPGPPNSEQIVNWVLKTFTLKNAPGAAYDYFNIGYAVLGLIFEKRAGKPPFGKRYDDYVLDMLKPISAEKTFFGSSFVSNPARNEVSYYDYPGAPLVDTVWPSRTGQPREQVPMPYGGFYVQAMAAHGGLVSNVSALLRFEASMNGTKGPAILTEQLSNIDQFKWGFVPFPPHSTDQTDWDFFSIGDFPGTIALLIMHDYPAKAATADAPATPAQHIGFAVLFNSRPNQTAADRNTMLDALKENLLAAAQAIKDWPSDDLWK